MLPYLSLYFELCALVIVIMDASPVQSGSKCSSDFSIERILSDRRESREESLEAPDWLCCTRYRPPRLPRPSVCRSRRAGRHARVPFTASQAAALEAAYARAPYLAPPALKALAAALNLRDDRIKIWFQNRRARERREKSVTISPPQGVTLPPTTLSSSRPSWMSQSSILTHHFTPYQRFNGPVTSGNLLQRFVPLDYSENVCKEDEERSTTPLDIESVED